MKPSWYNGGPIRGTGHAERAHRERQREARKIAARSSLEARHSLLKGALKTIVGLTGDDARALALTTIIEDDRRARDLS